MARTRAGRLPLRGQGQPIPDPPATSQRSRGTDRSTLDARGPTRGPPGPDALPAPTAVEPQSREAGGLPLAAAPKVGTRHRVPRPVLAPPRYLSAPPAAWGCALPPRPP